MHVHSDQYIEPNLTESDTVEIIKTHIKKSIPFSLSRIGDGEIYILNDNAPEFLVKKICRLWDIKEKDYNTFRLKCKEQIDNAIKYSDIIGIIDKNNEVCQKINCSPTIWSIKKSYVNSLTTRNMICDHQITRGKLLGDPHNLSNVINGEPINIITPNISINCNKLSDILRCDVTTTLVNNNRIDLLQEIKNIKQKIVLYGVSLTAKDLGVILKNDYSKIAIDMGATLDAWSGIKSRSWFNRDNIQGHCLIDEN